MKILVLGSKGMLGSDFCRELKRVKSDFIGWDIDDLDLTREKEAYKKLKSVNPNIIINCAGFTEVDGCESQSEKAFIVNGMIPYYLAKACFDMGSVLVHFSTDFIFDGRWSIPYKEVDLPNPISVYGSSKLEGERKIQEILEKYFIIRTAWLYGKNGRNFVEIILDMAKNKEELKIVVDQVGSPTHTVDLVRIALRLFETESYGLYNITNDGSCSRFEWTKKIIEIEKLNLNVIPCLSGVFPRPARRPAYSVLDNTKFNSLGIGKMENWKTALEKYLIDRKQ